MASNRHLGRIIVLQSLYEYEFRTKAGDATADIDGIVAKNIEPYAKALGDTEFVYTLARAVAGMFQELDERLQPMAPEWPLSTIAAIDRNVLRIGLYELAVCGDSVPPKVAINEAVELAKAFGSDNSSKFVNGVLGTAYRQIYGDTKGEEGQKTAAPSENLNEQNETPEGGAGQKASGAEEPKAADEGAGSEGAASAEGAAA